MLGDQRREGLVQFATLIRTSHLNSWLAFMPCARATSATLALALTSTALSQASLKPFASGERGEPLLNNPSAIGHVPIFTFGASGR
jgi:hypothetical protein